MYLTMLGGEEMTDIEKAKKLVHMFYILKKEHGRNSPCEGHIKHRDIMALGALSGFIEKNKDGLVKMSEISEYFHVTPAAISQMVREYERKGWVTRVTLESDRRSVYLKLTDETVTILHDCEANAMQGIVDFMNYLGDEDSDALLRILEKARDYGPIMKHMKKK